MSCNCCKNSCEDDFSWLFENDDDESDVSHLLKKFSYSGGFNAIHKGHVVNYYITEVIYHNPATIVKWSDDTKTVCKCHGDDVYSKETGLTMCILKKLIGSTKVHDIIENWANDEVAYICPDGSESVTPKFVRAYEKSKEKNK